MNRSMVVWRLVKIFDWWNRNKLQNFFSDLDTSHHLELLYPTCKTKEERACLFGVLNSCVTSIGKRNLRAQILQPSCELKQILKTQECIKELFANQELFIALEGTLSKFHSVDKLMKFAVLNTGVIDANNNNARCKKTYLFYILRRAICPIHLKQWSLKYYSWKLV